MARGKLRIYLGAAPGVGKTYDMLDEGWRRKHRGTDVVVGVVETHDRPKTTAQIRDLEVIPRKRLTHRGTVMEEMDLEAILDRRPEEALVDELAHTNVPGSRNEKRWQDIEELRDAGVDVISTVNIQHLASLNDVVERITGVPQRETVPDAVVRAADQIELVDMSPEALRRRLAHGNVYPPDKVDTALGNYFRPGNLTALRELALLWVADRVDEDLAAYRVRHGVTEPWETKERVVVALAGRASDGDLLRRGSRMAARTHGQLIAVHVRAADGISGGSQGMGAQRRLVHEFDGRYVEVTGLDVAKSLLNFAKAENATQLIVGSSRHSRWLEIVRGSTVNRVVRDAGVLDVHVMSAPRQDSIVSPAGRRGRRVEVPTRRRQLGWFLGTAGIAALGAALSPLRSSLGLGGALLCLLLAVIAVAAIGGRGPAAAASIVATLAGDFFFTVPYYSFRMVDPTQILDIVMLFAIAGVVSHLIDRLATRGVQIARAQAEAEALARLAGGSVLSGAGALPDLVTEIRRTFDLDGVAILRPEGEGWEAIAAAGAPVPPRPQDAPFSAELDQGAVLVLAGRPLSAEDTRLLNAFVAQLRMAQERLRLQHEAASAVELAEANSLRNSLLAAVSHDLRTPLAAIKAGATSLLSKEVTWSSEEAAGFARTINAESDRLTNLVSNLLDMSRLQTGALAVSLRPVSVDDVLYDAVASLGSAGSGIVIDVEGVLPYVAADPGLLERAVANVMGNALTWSPPGIAVVVRAGIADGRVDIRVIDQGPGIPVAQREAVFQPFQRLGDRVGASPNGVGLGLAVARGFMEAMRADLTIEDTPGGGTTMVFSLPRAGAGGSGE
jgi:two-component system, OmpR family, sensor histidine kinase KdpD